MFGANLIVLHWNLRQAGLLKDPQASIFYRSDADYGTFAEQNCDSLALYCPGGSHDARLQQLLKAQLAPQP